jgi:hypothetical protein
MHAFHAIHLTHTNIYAILVSTMIFWFLGATWYSPVLFVKPWMAALKIMPDHPRKGIAFGMVSSLVGDLILAFVLWHMVTWAGAETYGAGAFIGFLCWLGFFAAPNFPQGIYESRPTALFLVNNGYWLVGLLVVGGLLAVWR